MIINTSYFQNKEVYIPNSVAQPSIGSNTPNVVDSLNSDIDNLEREMLINAIGEEQTNELLSQFETNGDWKLSALQKWKDLVDGKDEWKGLRYTQGTQKYSLIAYFVYFYYLGNDFSDYTTTGIVVSDSANSTYQVPNAKQSKAWNKFIEMYNGYNSSNSTFQTFNNWNGCGITFNNLQQNKITLYKFLNDNREVYDVTKFKFLGVINTFGL